MKKFLATTAIALVIANGAIAQTATTDGAATEDTTSTDTMEPMEGTEAPADGTLAPADTMEPAGDMPAEGAADAPAEGMTDAPADTMTDAPAEGMTDAPADTMTETPDAGMDATTDMTDPAATDMAATSGAPAMTMDGYETMTNMDVTAEELTGTAVYGPDDEKVGDIGDLVIADDAAITEVIVDVGGFLGLGQKPVAIAFEEVQILKQVDGTDMRAYVSMTEEQLTELPEYEAPAEAMDTMEAAPATGMEAAPATDMEAPATDMEAPATDMEEAPATDAPATSN